MDTVQELAESLKADGDIQRWFLRRLVPEAERCVSDPTLAEDAASLLSKVAYHLSHEGREDLLPLQVRDSLVKLLPGGEEYVQRQKAWATAFRDAARAAGMHPWDALKLLVEGADEMGAAGPDQGDLKAPGTK